MLEFYLANQKIFNESMIVAGLFIILLLIAFAVLIISICFTKEKHEDLRELIENNKLNYQERVKKVSLIMYRVIEKFTGEGVGLKHDKNRSKSAIKGLYIQHILLFYWLYGTLMTIAFKPLESITTILTKSTETAYINSFHQALGFFTLLTINVVTDCVSILYTKKYLYIIATKESITRLDVVKNALLDFWVAFLCFSVAQLTSNGLYAIQTGANSKFFNYLVDPQVALKPYTPIAHGWENFIFPGQLFISLTTYIPSLAVWSMLIFTSMMSFGYSSAKMAKIHLINMCDIKTLLPVLLTLIGIIYTISAAINNLSKSL